MDMTTQRFNALVELMREARSIRRFDESERIPEEKLRDIVGCVRLTPSGRNLQPLRYRILRTRQECEAIFPALAWAGYLTDWDGPAEGERPAAYIVQCLDTSLTTSLLCDDGIELEAMTLGARALGLGSCIIRSFKADVVAEVAGLSAEMKPLYVMALGVPSERSEIVAADGRDADIRYWRDREGTMHVPKRTVDDRIISR